MRLFFGEEMDQSVLGDYKLVKEIGFGALGRVFLGEHRFIKKHYALKVLDKKLASDPGFVERFEKEISLLATLDHPHIVKIHHVSLADGLYFLVMDWVAGESGESLSLGQFLSDPKNKLSEVEAYTLLSQIASAIDYVQTKKQGDRSLSHQALRLTNILIDKRKEGFHAYLTDTGLSHLVGFGEIFKKTCKGMVEELIETERAGLEGFLSSTERKKYEDAFLQAYAFLAPEQKWKRYHSNTPDKKSDVFSFGILAYYLLMHSFPEGVFPKPSSKGLVKFNWDRLIKECLQFDPQFRPNSLVTLMGEINNKEKAQEEIDLSKKNAEISNSLSESSKVETHPLPNASPSPASQLGLKPFLQTPQLQRPETDLDPGAIFQVQSSVKSYSPEPKDVSHIEPLMTEMTVVSGGDFYRGSVDGSRDETPRHQITLSSFAIDIHPVTNEQFVRFLEVMGGEKDSHHNDIIRLRDSRIKRGGGKLTIESGYSRHPVVGVTWYGAVAYARWIGKRLPTEAEWEIAARGGKEAFLYPYGDDIEKSQANFFSSDTTGVMSYAPNEYGLYDMAGNVYEWCQDWYGYNYYEHSFQEPINPAGPLQGVYRVLRGGCWKSLKEDLRCSRRHRNNPGTVNSTYGFRCAADVQDSEYLSSDS